MISLTIKYLLNPKNEESIIYSTVIRVFFL